jgi:hypothetical protein
LGQAVAALEAQRDALLEAIDEVAADARAIGATSRRRGAETDDLSGARLASGHEAAEMGP